MTIYEDLWTIMKIYEGDLDLYHMDVCRLNGIGSDYDLEEYIYADGVCVIECLLYAHKPQSLPCLTVWDKLTLGDQRFLIWQLVHTGRIDPEALPYKGIASRIAERLDQV